MDIQLYAYFGYVDSRDEKHIIDRSDACKVAIFRDLEVLREKITYFGNQIRKRWRRKTPVERKAWMLQARPDLYQHKNPILSLAATSTSEIKALAQVHSFRFAHLLPYINLDSLSGDSARLIGPLHPRAVHTPQEWMLFDDMQIQIAWNLGCLAEKSAPGCICMNGMRHGEWGPFDRVEVHRRDAFSSPRALLILEA